MSQVLRVQKEQFSKGKGLFILRDTEKEIVSTVIRTPIHELRSEFATTELSDLLMEK